MFKNKVIDFRKSKVNDKFKVLFLVMFIYGKKNIGINDFKERYL